MVRSRNWPDLWWQISKIRDIQVVGIYDLMKRWRFETNRISSVATAQPQSQKPVFDFDLTWWPDLWWPGAEIFTQGVKFNCEQVLKKWRRCAPPFFRYPRKTGGVGIFCPPPSSARVKELCKCFVVRGSSETCLTQEVICAIFCVSTYNKPTCGRGIATQEKKYFGSNGVCYQLQHMPENIGESEVEGPTMPNYQISTLVSLAL